MEERREKIVDFVSNLFGIVGGVITVLGLVFYYSIHYLLVTIASRLFEGFLHSSTKALIGKND